MSRRSKYYNLDSFSSKWTKEEFSFAVLTLESMDRNALLNLLDKSEISFSGGNDDLDHEQLVAVLIDDVCKNNLLEALHWRA
jgi:hypothetical protein